MKIKDIIPHRSKLGKIPHNLLGSREDIIRHEVMKEFIKQIEDDDRISNYKNNNGSLTFKYRSLIIFISLVRANLNRYRDYYNHADYEYVASSTTNLRLARFDGFFFAKREGSFRGSSVVTPSEFMDIVDAGLDRLQTFKSVVDDKYPLEKKWSEKRNGSMVVLKSPNGVKILLGIYKVFDDRFKGKLTIRMPKGKRGKDENVDNEYNSFSSVEEFMDFVDSYMKTHGKAISQNPRGLKGLKKDNLDPKEFKRKFRYHG